jgi:hypothetical protein
MALAREAYARSLVRVADPDLTGYSWLVASPQGVFAVDLDGAKRVLHGWHFGIHRHGDALYLFENCGMRDANLALGRVIRLRLDGARLTDPEVLVTGLPKNCHQLAIIDGLLCVVDTTNQAIRRFTPDGAAVDVRRPFPAAEPNDTTGAYLHINSLAPVGERIALMLHNGPASPTRPSELAWLDRDWKVLARQPVPGHSCHDIVADERGTLWHTDSMAGDVIGSDGTRVKVTDELMTRAIAFAEDKVLVGMSTFGPRQTRHRLRGAVMIFDRAWRRLAQIELGGAPTDAIPLARDQERVQSTYMSAS